MVGDKLTQPIKWHGGKHYLAKRIIELMPPHIHYVEPFAGGLSVLLAKNPEGVSEVVNDIDKDLTTFWEVLMMPYTFNLFERICQATPFSSEVFSRAQAILESRHIYSEVNKAWAFFVMCRQSMSGRMDCFSPLTRRRTRRGMNEQASSWLNAVEGLRDVHERLRRVVVLCDDAVKVIKQQDSEATCFYCDPPYLHETRTATEVYKNEMTDDDHRRLLEALCQCKGSILLSGYHSSMYDEMLKGWDVHEFEVPNNSASGDSKRRMTEVVWVKTTT